MILVTCAMFTGCALRKPATPQTPIGYFEHVIANPGETLGLISLWYTGEESQWKTFFVPARQGGALNLRAGDTILIPMAQLIRHDPISQEFLRKHRKSKAKPTTRASKPPPRASQEPAAVNNEAINIEEPVENVEIIIEENAEAKRNFESALEDEFLEKSLSGGTVGAAGNTK